MSNQPAKPTLLELFVGFWRDSRQTLEVPLAPEQARERLEARVSSAIQLIPTQDGKPLVGRVHAKGFSIATRKAYQNSFDTVARGRWRMEGSRLQIDVRYGVRGFVKVFMAFWLSAVGLGGSLFTIAVLLGVPIMTSGPNGQVVPADPAGNWVLALGPLGVFMAGVALCIYGRHLARDEEARLRRALDDALGRR